MKLIRLIYFIPIILCFSCTSYKQVPYFQDFKRDSVFTEDVINYAPLVVQTGDLLGVHVSSLNHEADMIYNYNLDQTNMNSESIRQTTIVGFLVDQDGNINMPNIGLIKVSGKTIKEIDLQIEKKLETYLSKPVVIVRLLNFKVSVLGDVKSPGYFNVPTERITFLEALGLAGDLNTTALRKKVTLIREQNGVRQYINIDLTSKKLSNSPYYFLKNNDVIYVEPNRIKITTDDQLITKLGAVVSVLSILLYLKKK